MVDITTVPQEELTRDLAESYADMAVCRIAIRHGIIRHRDGYPVQERLDANRKIAAMLIEELIRRAFDNACKEASCVQS